MLLFETKEKIKREKRETTNPFFSPKLTYTVRYSRIKTLCVADRIKYGAAATTYIRPREVNRFNMKSNLANLSEHVI